jgi:hypothetical protein
MTTARDIMHAGATCVGEQETLSAAAQHMRDLDTAWSASSARPISPDTFPSTPSSSSSRRSAPQSPYQPMI